MNRSSIKTWQVFLPLAILCLIVVFYHGLYGNPSYIPPVIVNTPAPDFIAPELYEEKGQRAPREMRLSDYKGKVVVLNFWASWCTECALEHPSLLEINQRYAQDPRFVMLGVNYQDKENPAKEYLAKHGNNFKHVRDFSGKISIDYGIYGVPETFVIDKQGMIRHKSIGPIIGQ
ncbi:MAG: redoxin domain-containing protein, partial [Deltaproteobacteria bacterium]|nr:redoxin domain-containing protein [Deltaproteobacteria bacterium]